MLHACYGDMEVGMIGLNAHNVNPPYNSNYVFFHLTWLWSLFLSYI